MAENIADFGIKIEANTKAIDEIVKKIDVLTEKVEESSEKTDKAVQKNVDSFKKLTKEATKLTVRFLSIKKIVGSVFNFQSEAEGIGRLAKMASVSTDTIQDLGNALKNYGGSASSASSTLAKLNKQLFDLRLGKGGALAKVVMQYGLDTSAKSPEDMLLNISKRMQGMSALQQVSFGRALGLDNATIMLLQQGVAGVRKELEKAKELRVFDKEDIENASKIQREWRELEVRLRQISAILLRWINPVIKAINKELLAITKDIKEHPNLIKGIGVALGILLLGFKPIWFILMAGAVILQDWLTYLRGGDSVIGSILQKLYEWRNIFKWIGIALLGITFPLKTLAYFIGQWLGELLTTFFLWLFNLDWGAIGDKIKDVFIDTVKKLKDLWTAFMKWLKGDEETYSNNSLIQDALSGQPVATLGNAIMQQTDGWALNGMNQGTIGNAITNNSKATNNVVNIENFNLQSNAMNADDLFEEARLQAGGLIGNYSLGTGFAQ